MFKLDKKSFAPIYYQVGSYIKDEIISGRFPLNSKLPSEEAYSKDLGIAKRTLRRALSKLAQEGYVRQIRGKGSFVVEKLPGKKTISIIVDRDSAGVSSSSLPKSISGIIMYLKEQKCSVRIDHLDDLDQLLDERKFGECALDGVIALMIANKSLHKLDRLTQAGIPFVSDGVRGPFNWVDINHILGMEKAFNYLVDLGHTEIGIGSVRAPDYALDIDVRFKVAEKLLTSHFGGLRDDYHLHLRRKSREDVLEQTLEFLMRKDKPTAMLCTSDWVAVPLVVQAPFAGLRVPDDMSVIGFEAIEASRFTSPTLTTVYNDYFKVGQVAAEELLAIIDDCSLRKINRQVEPELIVESSCSTPSR